jgi:hypothetical protein
MITGLPSYKPPISQTVRCVCSAYYLVYLGAPFPFDHRACEAAREDARRRGALFIDARTTPFMLCSCGEALIFVEDECLTVM